jgi:hypothetical protein
VCLESSKNWSVPEEHPSCPPIKECADEKCEIGEPRCFKRREFDDRRRSVLAARISYRVYEEAGSLPCSRAAVAQWLSNE